MGSPQAAHLGANTLGEKQRSRQVHTVVFLEGKAKCFWETCSWGLQGALLTGPALPPPCTLQGNPSSPRTKRLTVWEWLQYCFRIVPEP